MEPLTFNAVIAIVILLYYLAQGALQFRFAKDAEGFFLYNRQLPGREYAASFAAASVSLATVFFFFVSFASTEGLYLLFAPFTYMVGAYLYNKLLVPRLADQGFIKGESPSNQGRHVTATFGAYIESRYGSAFIKYLVVLITAIWLLFVLLIELFVGVTIFSIYLKEHAVDAALIFISLVVFGYATLGGFMAVVKTDVVQLWLMWAAILALLGWFIWQALSGSKDLTLTHFFPHSIVFQGGFLLPWPLLLNILTVNICLLPALLRTWQMAAASKSKADLEKGVARGVSVAAVLGLLLTLIGVFFKILFPNEQPSTIGVLKTLAGQQNQLSAYVFFPLLFAACLSAMLSTADSALIPVLHSMHEDLRKPQRWRHGLVFGSAFVILLLVNFAYFFFIRFLKYDLISLLFTLFGLIIILTPAAVFAVLAPDSVVKTKAARVTACISILGGFLCALALSIAGTRLQMPMLVQLTSPVGVAFGSLCFGILLLVKRH